MTTNDYRRTPELLSRLSDEQHRVTQQDGTEPAYRNEYWDNHEPGIYVDIVSGQPLFSSTDKFDSGPGSPSVTRPINSAYIVRHDDKSWGMLRTEVRSTNGDSHLGHLFDDGPIAEGGMRYCINSAALRFIPVDQLEAAGYGDYRSLFTTTKGA